MVVPARDEAAMLPLTLPTLLAQSYPGRLSITIADDHSSDGTGDLARTLARAYGANVRASVITVPTRPQGWAGKVWAMASALAAARAVGAAPTYWLFTDADIAHHPNAVADLVATAQADRRDLVSLMVRLTAQTPWEKLLVPAFVFFFAKLYPFSWVADDRRRTAGAAGGCMLVADTALERIGGLQRISGALIDDCSLAAAIKAEGGRLRLELSTQARSVRPYESLSDIWNMVARSAYTQLNASPLLLAGTIAGMLVLYALPPLAAIAGVTRRDRTLALGGFTAWALMSAAYLPVLRRYDRPRWEAPALPFAALMYTAMTLDSGWRHLRGRGGSWKGRIAARTDVSLTQHHA